LSLITLLVLPLLAAALCWLLPNHRLAPALTFATSLAVLALAFRVALNVARGNPVIAFHDVVAADGLSALVVLLVALVGATGALYSWGYMAKTAHEPKKLRLYYANYNLFMFAMIHDLEG
jgi:formate hydrogenlyase subunit 3/multisubunit Na+/H+ antiporter MnhD subunit